MEYYQSGEGTIVQSHVGYSGHMIQLSLPELVKLKLQRLDMFSLVVGCLKTTSETIFTTSHIHCVYMH